MIAFIRKQHIKILIISGFVFMNVLALISTVCNMPKGNTLNAIGAYVGFVLILSGMFLLGKKIIHTRKRLGVLLIFLSLVIAIVLIFSFINLLFKC